MGRSLEAPWVKKVVAWNPASVWTTYSNDAYRRVALDTGFSRATATEDPGRREEYFNFVFGMPPSTQPNPEEWYRGDRDQYSNDGTQKPFRAEWPCKWDYIGAARLEYQEIYHPASRRWHWRLGTEVLDFSFFNDNWLGPANTARDQGGNPANYLDIVKPTLLVASDDDDWNEGDLFGTPPRHWENRFTRVRVMAPKMTHTPGFTLYVPNTGHSIHNERPNFFANQIVGFLSGPIPTALISQAPLDEFDESKMPWDSCKPQLSQFVAPIPQLLDNPDSATFLMEPAQLGGRFSNNKTAGQYGLRLQAGLRGVAAAQDPANALVHAAVSFYNGDTVVGNAFADLAVTGRTSYGAFQKHQTTRDEIVAGAKALKWGSNPHFAVDKPVLTPPIDEGKLSAAAEAALNRAYQVAWALRNPDPLLAYWFRQTLGWIAVSGEDDPPDRPVNVPSGIPIFDQIGNQISAYPQFDLSITTCRAPDPTVPPSCLAANAVNTAPVTVSMQIRYTIASSDSAGPSRIPPVAVAPNTPGTSASADKGAGPHLR